MTVSLIRIRGRKGRAFALRLAVMTGMVLLACATLADIIYFKHRIYPGVRVTGCTLGGQPPAAAAAILENLEITFRGPDGKKVNLPLRELGIIVESEKVFHAAHSQGRRYCWPLSYWERYNIAKNRPAVPLEYRLEGEALLSGLDSLEERFNTAPRDATFQVCAYELQSELLPERPGYRVIKEELLRQLLVLLARRGEPLTFTVPCAEISAAVTALSLKEKGIETLMISFTTEFDMSNEDRIHNLRLASAAFHNRLLAPGELLSVNNVIGNTTPDKGYRKAPVIIGGDIIQGFGGGLCQVSSTLYNAVLLADLEILERHHHQFTVPYLPPGRDATVEYGSRDLLFRNNKNHHILIHTLLRGNRLTFRLFGATPERKVEITTRELAVIEPPERVLYDPNLPSGTEEVEEGDPGYVVEVWKTVYRGSREESRVLLSVDRYIPYPTLIRRGP